MKLNQPRYIKQYATGILDYSSQYGSENARSFSYSIGNLVGEPQIFPKYGDYTQAAVMRTYGSWWKSRESTEKDKRPKALAFCSEDYIDLVFEQAVYPWSIAIYETYNPGALVRILALCQKFPDLPQSSTEVMHCEDNSYNNVTNQNLDVMGKLIPVPSYGCSHWEVLWESRKLETDLPSEARMFAPILREIKHRTRVIRLEFCHRHLNYYTELDAVELTGMLHFSRSSSVDPPNSLMLRECTIPDYITPSSSTEELAYAESKIDLKSSQCGSDVTMATVTSSFTRLQLDVDDEIRSITDELPYGYFSLLPSEIISKIFGYLPLPDFCKAARVCNLFREHSYDTAHLTCIDLHSYWHLVDANTLNSIFSRFPSSESDKRIDKSITNNRCLTMLNLAWVGGGDTIDPDIFSSFFTLCDLSQLQHLNLASTPGVTDHILKILVQVAPHVQHLDLQSCDKITAEGIRILHEFTNLHYLSLYRTKADDAGVICIVQTNPNLTHLNLGSCLNIIDFNRVMEEIALHCPKLQSIDMWRAKSLTMSGLNVLVTSCCNIEELDLGWCGALISNTGCFDTVAECCPHLTKLFLTANRTLCDADILKIADCCPQLRQLDILGTRLVTRVTIEYLLSRCNQLEFLDLSFCYSFTIEVINSLRLAYPNVAIKRSFQD